MSAIRVDQNILNQRGTPAFFADNFSRRPAAGYQGRIFISADTHEIYRDDTTAWVLIADAGAGSGTLQSVTANGNTTSYGIDILGVGLRVQSGGITDYTIPSGGIMFGSPSYLLTTDTTNLFWDDTNNRLGLGTNTPGARLDIHATGTNATFNGTGTSNSTLVFQRSGTSRWTIGNYYSSAVADDFNIYDNVNSQYRFYIHNTGVINIPTSLIIGSSTPTSSYILDVTGNSNVTGTFRTTGAITSLSSINSNTLLVNATAQANVTALIQGKVATAGTALKVISDGNGTDKVFEFTGSDGVATQTMTMMQSGNVGIGISSPNNRLSIYDNSTADSTLYVKNDHATSGDYTATFRLQSNTNNTSSRFLTCSGNDVGGNGDALIIYGNGNVVNVNNSYGTLSDIRLKENIIDATPKLDDLLQLKVKNFNLIGHENKQIGFIADEFEEVFPKMVEIDGKSGMKLIKTSILVPMLVKAIQEQQSQIEELKALINNIN
jgi:hypothetical protein